MITSIRSPEDAVNAALARIGHPHRVDFFFEGSVASRLALVIYGQTRDEILRLNDWDFAERSVTMTLLKQAPANGYPPTTPWNSTYPPLPWFFEYAYPPDCLKVRAVKATPGLIPVFDPQPNLYSEVNDQTLVPPAQVILCYIAPPAQLVYTGRITNPDQWNASFAEALIDALAERLEPVLGAQKSTPQEASAEAMRAFAASRGVRG